MAVIWGRVKAGARVAAAFSAATLAACGGGGGGGSAPSTTAPTAPTAPTTPTTPATPATPAAPTTPTTTTTPAIPSAASAEYTANYGLAMINALSAYQAGATGKGVTVGVVDSGVDASNADLAANVSPLSADIVAGRNQPGGYTNTTTVQVSHGTLVAGVIAAGFNGFGSLGVAYQSTILSVRTDSAGSCATSTTTSNNCSFSDVDLAAGITYAVANGARIINLSLGGPGGPDSPVFEAALANAVKAGVVFTIASGNVDSGTAASNPYYPALYAIDPRFQGSILAVGAVTSAKTMASYSNLAGAAAADYLVAPGDQIVTGCTSSACWVASGTSFAAPHVAGALALLLQGFPNLSGAQAVAILLQTADPLGPASTYGAGLVDIAKAFQPVGTLSVQTAQSQISLSSTGQTPGLALTSTAIGNAIRRTTALQTVGYDRYDRLFAVNLASVFRTAPLGRAAPVGQAAPSFSQSVYRAPSGLNLTATTADPVDPPLPGGLWSGGMMGLGQLTNQGDLAVSLEKGPGRVLAWSSGSGAAPPPQLAAASDPFAALARADKAVRTEFSFSGLTFGAESGEGQAHDNLFTGAQTPSRYSLASAAFAGPAYAAALSYGRVVEPRGVLGADLSQGAATAMPGVTDFTSFSGVYVPPLAAVVRDLAVSGQMGVGRSQAQGQILTLAPGALSTTWRLALSAACSIDLCNNWTLSLHQPLRMESGVFETWLADVPAHYLDPITYSRRQFSAASQGREIDLDLAVARKLGPGEARLSTGLVSQENNEKGAPLDLLVGGRWDARF